MGGARAPKGVHARLPTGYGARDTHHLTRGTSVDDGYRPSYTHPITARQRGLPPAAAEARRIQRGDDASRAAFTTHPAPGSAARTHVQLRWRQGRRRHNDGGHQLRRDLREARQVHGARRSRYGFRRCGLLSRPAPPVLAGRRGRRPGSDGPGDARRHHGSRCARVPGPVRTGRSRTITLNWRRAPARDRQLSHRAL